MGWGKWAAGAVGFIVGGPVGAIIGVGLGVGADVLTDDDSSSSSTSNHSTANNEAAISARKRERKSAVKQAIIHNRHITTQKLDNSLGRRKKFGTMSVELNKLNNLVILNHEETSDGIKLLNSIERLFDQSTSKSGECTSKLSLQLLGKTIENVVANAEEHYGKLDGISVSGQYRKSEDTFIRVSSL